MTTNTQTAAASYRKKNVSHIQRHLIPSYIFLIIVSFISVFPFYWMISAATNKSLDVANGKLTFGTYAAENSIRLTTENDLWGTLGNSFLYALVQAVLALFICSLAGFGFELYHDKAKDRLFGILLLAMMVPQVATMIPLFRMISKMKLLNTVWAFILPSISTPFLMQKALRVPSNKQIFDHTGAVHSYMQLYFIIFIISYYFHGERGILCQTSITANFQNRNFLKKTV